MVSNYCTPICDSCELAKSMHHRFYLIFSIWQHFEPTLAYFYALWHFHCCKWPKLKKPSGHTTTTAACNSWCCLLGRLVAAFGLSWVAAEKMRYDRWMSLFEPRIIRLLITYFRSVRKRPTSISGYVDGKQKMAASYDWKNRLRG